MIIGVTGPSGAGKSEFSSLLAAGGYIQLDCDRIYHDLTASASACTSEIATDPDFGSSVLNSSGGLDRQKLAELVFAPGAADKLQRLNHITHKYVLAEVRHRIALLPDSSPGAVIDAPLLFESSFDNECDFTVAVLAPSALRMERLLARDRIERKALEARMAAGKPDSYYLSNCDYTVYNNGSPAHLLAEADRIISDIVIRSKK